jgi:hypothetical protein
MHGNKGYFKKRKKSGIKNLLANKRRLASKSHSVIV